MKKREVQVWSIFLFMIGCGLVSCHPERNGNFLFQYVDPLQKVFKETAFFPEKEAEAWVARGENASFQFVFRADRPVRILDLKVTLDDTARRVLDAPWWGYVDYVRVGRKALQPASDRLTSVSGFYPDPIVPVGEKGLRPGESQPLWVSVGIPETAPAGIYRGTVTITIQDGKRKMNLSSDFSIRVFKVTLRERSLWVTNWYGTSFSYMNGGMEVPPYSEKYWESMEVLARMMARYHQNVVMISPLTLGKYSVREGLHYEIDFSRFVRTVKLFRHAGALKRIEGGHLAARESTWSSPFAVLVPVQEGDTVMMKKMSIHNDTARSFYRQFLPALLGVLKEHEWDNVYMQHIADEPVGDNAASYIEIARFVKEHLSGIPIIEACHTSRVENTMDIWVPQLDFLESDWTFYRDRLQKGEEVWFYTCLAPKGEYANRFIDLPLIKTRILHWINFRYHVPGYLHWGFNRWDVSGDPYGETTGINKESGNILPGGDAWIVYPGRDTLFSSLRLEAMRDGINDYELLKMLEEKDPEAAASLAHQVVFGFHTYETNVENFRTLRKKVLCLLSDQQ